MDFHLILPRNLTLQEAHDEVTRLEKALKRGLGVADAFVHTEPCVDPECAVCGKVPCPDRGEPERYNDRWERFTEEPGAEEDSAGVQPPERTPE